MDVVISLLRGVNVGGHNKIKMAALVELYASLGLRDAQTYVQSGNVVFRTKDRDLSRLAGKIGKGIEESFGFRPEVILRTCSELREAIAKNPYATRGGIEPNKLLLTFLSSDPEREAREKVIRMKVEPEELRIDGRHLYIYFPNGMARPKLSLPLIEKTLKIPGTGRNWNTVNRLLELAEKLEER
jgi:uncharacterized protein (DUF1697 family)